MPLLDHFHPPLHPGRHWQGFHSKWANVMVDLLNDRLLPPHHFAEPFIKAGARVEIDVATWERGSNGAAPGASGTVTLQARPWAPPTPTVTVPLVFTDTFEVQVISTEEGYRLVAAIEIVSPANKDRPETRRAFAVKCASYLYQGVGLIVVDIVTDRLANLHDEIVSLLPTGQAALFPEKTPLYATAYRPVRRESDEHAVMWLEPLRLGQALPVLPLYLNADLPLAIDLEATYQDACRHLRLPT